MNAISYKDTPIKVLDVFDFKNQYFGQMVQKGIFFTMNINNNKFSLSNDNETRLIDKTINIKQTENASLYVVFDNKHNSIYIMDIFSFNNKPFAMYSLSKRFKKIKELSENITACSMHISVCYPGSIEDLSGEKIRLLRDNNLNILEYPGYIWEKGGTKVLLKVEKNFVLLSSDGAEMLRNFKKNKLKKSMIGKTMEFSISKNKEVIPGEIQKYPHSTKYAKTAILSLVGPLRWEDLKEFKKTGRIPDLNKRDNLLVNNIKNKGQFIKYSRHPFIDMHSDESPEIAKKLSAIYEIKILELSNKIHEKFPNTIIKKIQKNIPQSYNKQFPVDYIIGHTGCIVCGYNDTIFHCKNCRQKIICRDCINCMGKSKKKYICDFCEHTDIVDYYCCKENDTPEGVLVLVDNNDLFKEYISSLSNINTQWTNIIAKIGKQSLHQFFCEIGINFGADQKKYFNRLVSIFPFSVRRYNICSGKDSSLKTVFDINSPIEISYIKDIYKKNTIKCVEERKFGFQFKLKYNEKIPQPHTFKRILRKISVIEYSYRVSESWTVCLRKGNNNHEILICGPSDEGVNDIICKVMKLLF